MLVFACLVVIGNVSANQSQPAESDNSQLVLPGPAPGTRGNAGLLGLDPWTVVNPAPVAVSRPGGVFLDGLFYVVGGEETGGNRNGFVQIYDPDTDTWDSASADPMPVPGSNLCAAAVDGLIYVPGGWDGATLGTNVQIFDPATGSWTTDTDDPLPAGRYGSACAAHDGRLYVFGGWDGAAGTSSAWAYDPQQTAGSRWSTLSNSSFSHVYGAGIAASNGLIFVTGVSDNASGNFATVAAYDPAADDWIAYPDLQTARGGAAAWIVGNQLYVGGGGWASYLTSVESYDLSEGTSGSWEFTASLNAGRRTFAYGSDPATGQLFAAAGWAGAFLASAESTAGEFIQLDITPLFGSVIDLGSGGSGDQLAETITAENTGSADVDLDCTLSDDGGGVFSLLPNDPYSITLAPTDDPVDFSVQCAVPALAPGVTENYSGELSCTTSDPQFPGQNTFELICEGVGPTPEPGLAISPSFGNQIDFGAGDSGDQLTEIITAENTGNVDVDLDCTISDSAGGVFSLLPNDPFSATLAPTDDPVDFSVQCAVPALAPGVTENYSGELSCTTSDPEFPGQNTFELTCEGSGGPVEPVAPAIAVSTLSPWGLLVLLLGLLALASYSLRTGYHR